MPMGPRAPSPLRGPDCGGEASAQTDGTVMAGAYHLTTIYTEHPIRAAFRYQPSRAENSREIVRRRGRELQCFKPTGSAQNVLRVGF
jgi:hypothetical protein